MLARPSKVYDFTAFARRQPSAPPPGDRIDAQLQNHADAITAVQMAVEKLKPEPPEIDIKALAADIVRHAAAELGELRQSAGYAKALADQAQHQLQRMFAEADRARDLADRAEARLQAAVEKAQVAVREATLPTPILGPNAGGFYAGDEKGATATAADFADVAINWAEYMPTGSGTDTIPPNILAINAISGDHWSSRWWANRSANAFGMLAWWYMGAWPGPPPSTPLTPTGQPIPPGAMYFNTGLGMMLVWNGSSWVPLAQGPAKATTSSLYYLAAAGQTVFPLSVADRFGHTFAFNQTATEGLQGLVNGVRLEPTIDFTVDTVGSSVTFLRPLAANAIVTFDILTSTTQLIPSGTVNTVLLSPIVPDGVKTTFTGLTVAANGSAVNVAKNEELLVSVDGIQQSPGQAYNALGASITFAEAPFASAAVFMLWFGPGPVSGAPPANSALPAISGGLLVGQTLTCSQGSWTGAPTSYAYQWLRDGVAISGATGSTYLLVTADGGHNLSCSVTAANVNGITAASSNPVVISTAFTYPGTPTGLYSLRKVGAGYNGSCLRVQRSSDSTQQDIGFDASGNVNVAAATAFAGGALLTVAKWYDQSGVGLDLAQATAAAQPQFNLINGKPWLSFAAMSSSLPLGLYLVTATVPNLTGNQAIGFVGQSMTDIVSMPMAQFDGTNGWFLTFNGSGSSITVGSNPGVFQYFTTNGSSAVRDTGRYYARTNRYAAKRLSGTGAIYVNGAQTATGTAANNAASTAKLALGSNGDGTFPFTGLISEVFVYASTGATDPLTDANRLAIDASQSAYFADTGFSTPYSGASCVEFGISEAIVCGNVLAYERTASWTAFAAVQLYATLSTGSVFYTNVPNSGTGGPFPGHEMWVDNLGHIRIRLISNIAAGNYAGVIGTTNIVDGKKHMIAYSYDGSSLVAGVKVYIDGNLETTTVEHDALTASIIGAGQSLYVGSQQGVGTLYTAGVISHFQIDNVVRSQAYIAAYVPGSGTLIPPVVAGQTDICLALNAGSGTAAADTSGNAHNGALSSATMWAP